MSARASCPSEGSRYFRSIFVERLSAEVFLDGVRLINSWYLLRNSAAGRSLRLLRTPYKLVEHRRADTHRFLADSFMDIAAVGMFWFTPDGRFFRVNQESCAMTGYAEQELLAMSVGDLTGASQEEWEGRWRLLREHRRLTYESVQVLKDGSIQPIEIDATFVVFEGAEFGVGLARNITERQRLAVELVRLASTDRLTGLYNRSEFAKQLERTLGTAGMAGESVAVLFIDLDKFKQVNDALGHVTGDQVLVAVAHGLSECLPAGAHLARWGGDEFVAALTGIDAATTVLETAASIRDRLTDTIAANQHRVHIDATIGIAIFPRHGTTLDELIQNADMAMYAGRKENTRVRVFDPRNAE